MIRDPRRLTQAASLAVALGLLVTTPGRAQDEPEPAGEPRIHLDEKLFDFGEVIQGSTFSVDLPIHNRGTADLLIRQVDTSCGCTGSEYTREPIPPGGAGRLRLEFDSTDRAGMQNVIVQIYTNDPSQNDRGRYCTILQVRGEVRSLYRANPSGVYFGELVRGLEVQTREVVVRGTDSARGFRARLVSSHPDHIQVEQRYDDEARIPTMNLTIRVLPHVPPGELHEVLVFETDNEEQPQFRLPVVGIVSGRINSPDFVQFLRVSRLDGAQRRIPLERRDGEDGIPVTRLEYDEDLLAVSIQEMSGTRVDLILDVKPAAPPGPFSTYVRIHLDVAEQPLIELPVMGYVMARVVTDPPLLLPDAAGEVLVRLSGGGRVVGAKVMGLDGLTTSLEEVDEGVFRVRLEGDRPSRRGTLVIETDVPGEEQVTVPLLE
jgi:Protein of unknown function (DUF1573)